MIVYEFKLKGKDPQYRLIDEAIRTGQFIRNKALRYWMDNQGVNKYDLNKQSAILSKEFKFADKLNSSARQSACERAWSAISRFYENCKKNVLGKKGFPKFQKNNRSIEYKKSGWKLSENRKKLTLTDKHKIGTLKLIGSRDLNYYQIEQIQRVRIVKRADGYYAQLCIKADVRNPEKFFEPTGGAIGLDVGLKYFYVDSNGNTVENPQYYRHAEKQLNRLNRQKSKKFRQGQKQSNRYLKAKNRYSRKHLKVIRQRRGYATEIAYRVVQSNDLIAYEDLKVKNMVKNRKLAKSISDISWSTFRQWLEYFAFKYGKVTVAVRPHNTSQNCSNCGKKVEKSLSTRTHICPHCKYVEDRDVNAAQNILKKGLSTVGHTGTYAQGDLPSWLVGVILLANGESMN
ncbi:MAG: transposase [Prochloraceae cyanobacterium]|nr:transposase [Prochloraceae cyanobacterium]